jgi:hypothetical protein
MPRIYCPCGKYEDTSSVSLIHNGPELRSYVFLCDECRREIGREDKPEDDNEDLVPTR